MGPERYQKKFGSPDISQDPSWPRQCVNAQENDGDPWSCSDTWTGRRGLDRAREVPEEEVWIFWYFSGPILASSMCERSRKRR
jgi:hypothetical protein